VNEQQMIQDGEYVEHFMKSEAWERTVARLKQRYADSVMNAPNPDAAVRVWQVSQALTDVVNEMGVTVGNGTVAKIKKTAAEKAKAAQGRK
jgi:hypothetical protein